MLTMRYNLFYFFACQQEKSLSESVVQLMLGFSGAWNIDEFHMQSVVSSPSLAKMICAFWVISVLLCLTDM